MKNQQPLRWLDHKNRLMQTARIHDLKEGTSYDVSHEDECKDKTDASAYRECTQSGKVITMGSVIVEPIS